MGVDNQQVVRILENSGVAIQKRSRLRDGGENAVGNLLDIKQRWDALSSGGARVSGTKHGLFEQGRPRPASA